MQIRVDPLKCNPRMWSEACGCRPVHEDFVFNRFDPEDGRRGIFTETAETAHKRRLASREEEFYSTDFEIEARKRETGRYADQDDDQIDLPPCLIRIEDEVNDTELPGLEFDVSTRELSFEWEGIFAKFYRELAELDRRTQKRNDLPDSEQTVLSRDRRNIRRTRIQQQHDEFRSTLHEQLRWPADDSDTEYETSAYRSMRDWKDELNLPWNSEDIAVHEVDLVWDSGTESSPIPD